MCSSLILTCAPFRCFHSWKAEAEICWKGTTCAKSQKRTQKLAWHTGTFDWSYWVHRRQFCNLGELSSASGSYRVGARINTISYSWVSAFTGFIKTATCCSLNWQAITSKHLSYEFFLMESESNVKSRQERGYLINSIIRLWDLLRPLKK